MNRRGWVINPWTWWRRFRRNERGEAMVSFGLMLPLMGAVSLGILEFSLLVFDYHRAGEATRHAVRVAAINAPVADMTGFDRGMSITCSSSGGTVDCGSASVANSSVYEDMVLAMQEMFPNISGDNLVVEYRDSGLGDPAKPGGIIPLITVRLVDLKHPFLMLAVFPDVPDDFTYPPFTTNQLGNGIGQTI